MTNPNQPTPENPEATEATDATEEFVADELTDTEGLDPQVAPDVDGDGEVSDLELQLAERTEDLQRVSAEYANYRRRTDRERTQIADLAKVKIVSQLLPLLDDLELARQHGDLQEGPLKAFADNLAGVLTGHGVAPFGDEGDAFDPEIHEAVQDLSSGDDKVIGTVLRRGYKLGDKLIRNAMVIIADPAE
ncbi:nucleotide exchange factor GrpE [Corynebacterium sp. MSK044]|uniref:nucleotide exchange factor GrpE n=1 Tax=Corynebacterium sp. MSK044 TaxID=3050195 RepID=UPI002550F4DF|nr:nucleotide exchange factor GrpE [Corynebacterium sp. MSK044]MDK8797886.1 nucleotide exchange factor GrpE [Corynebacterium sp. MSK044]